MLHYPGAITQIKNSIFGCVVTIHKFFALERKETRLKTQSAHLRSNSLIRSETLQNAPLGAACPSSFSDLLRARDTSRAGVAPRARDTFRTGDTFRADRDFSLCNILKARASVTVEAAIAVPLMIFALFLLIFPMMVMESERKLQNQMETVSKNLTLAQYISTAASTGLNLEEEKKEAFEGLVSGLEEGISLISIQQSADSKYLKNCAFDAATGIFSEDSDAGDDMVYIKFNYCLNFPFSIFNLSDVNKSLVTNRRAWIGSSGGRGREKYGEELEDEDGDGESDDGKTVYVAGNGDKSKVYHTNSHCHYISNDFDSASSVAQMEGKKNKYGAYYKPCDSCGAAHSSGAVYFTESGRKYHSSPGCKANSYSIEERKLSELIEAGYHECTYCAGMH